MTSEADRIKLLEARVHNLELALHGLMSVAKEMMPPDMQHSVSRIGADHFDASRTCGGFRSVEFIEAVP